MICSVMDELIDLYVLVIISSGRTWPDIYESRNAWGGAGEELKLSRSPHILWGCFGRR